MGLHLYSGLFIYLPALWFISESHRFIAVFFYSNNLILDARL